MLIDYICPKCRETLAKIDNSYTCVNRHSYDISSAGYVNLYSGKMQGGDSKEMSRARRDFLAGGYYGSLANALCDVVLKYKAESIVDMGCGEGYYDRVIMSETHACVNGVDLSKEAVRLAAKAAQRDFPGRAEFCVASIFDMPFSDCTFDAALSVFAPVADMEALRILKKGGHLIVVTPGKLHLEGLKTAIYEKPYDNQEKDKQYADFDVEEVIRVNDRITVSGENIANLFLMTPYYWKTSEKDAAKLKVLDTLDTDIDFVITVYRKI